VDHVFKRAALALRRQLPGPVRRALRLARHVFAAPVESPPMPPALVAACRLCASREELVAQMPRGGRVAEVGVEAGAFSRRILKIAAPEMLHLIDLDLSRLDASVRGDGRVTLHEGDSAETLAAFPDDHFDWIYIDGDHSLAGVARDAEAAAAKVRPGGHLVFNDFAHVDPALGAYGVHRAVMAFAIARSWPFAWFAYERHGLYDVALKRPDAGDVRE
jgi:SAM-dependent methyltransferase